MPWWVAALGTAVSALIVQGRGVVLLPYAFTHWQPGTPQWPVVVRVIGVVLIAVGGIVVAWAFAQFAAEGAGADSGLVQPGFSSALCWLEGTHRTG